MSRTKFACAITLAFFFLVSCADRPTSKMAPFTGMWKLDKYESFDPTDSKWKPTVNRTGYAGYILYDGEGHMGVQLLPPNFMNLSIKNTDSLSNGELQKNLRLYAASFDYFANCSITDSNIIEHHRVSSNHPDEWGTIIERSFEFRGDTLILTAKELIGGLKTRLRWIKLR